MGPSPRHAPANSPSCVFVSAEPFFWGVFAGIPRYTARLALALAAHVPVRFFVGGEEVLAPESLDWSQDQDLEEWGRAIARSERRPLGSPAADCIGLYCLGRNPGRAFPYEVNIIHDFCAMILPWAFPPDLRDGFVKFLTEHILESDFVLADSHATKADAFWFSPLDAEQIVVAPPGPSLCVKTHCHRDPVARSDRIGLVVSTIEPRKNAGFLLDWFHSTTLLPRDIELWWVGKPGWGITLSELERMARPDGGRRVRFLDTVGDTELCLLYQMASWSIYPSKYEGFGFPILDSLRHGTPVLASGTSSMKEFDHPGVYFFDPHDPSTVDFAWQRHQEATEPIIQRERLDQLYNWDRVAGAILDAYAHSDQALASGRSQPNALPADDSAPHRLPCSEAEPAAPSRFRTLVEMRIGIGPFTVQTASHNRGLGRYIRSLVSALVARDQDSNYVLYCQDGLTADQLPKAPNVEVRRLQSDVLQSDANVADAMARLLAANPDGVDVFLLLNAPELGSGYRLPARASNAPKVAALIHDLIPLFFQPDDAPSRPAAERPQPNLESLNRLESYDAVLATSEANRESLMFLLRGLTDHVVTIGTAVDEQFFNPDRCGLMPVDARPLFQKLGITGPFVLSVGSMEYQRVDHSRMLIEAFAMLPDSLREVHQLVLTYDLSPKARKYANRYASERGVADRLVLTDRLAERALRVLYQRCAAFVSLTSYEEMGMPVLEAMHCGAPVVFGNSAAQLELASAAGLAFNVNDTASLSRHLESVLGQPDRAQQLSERALSEAGRFSMHEVAGRVLDLLACRPVSFSPRPCWRAPRHVSGPPWVAGVVPNQSF